MDFTYLYKFSLALYFLFALPIAQATPSQHLALDQQFQDITNHLYDNMAKQLPQCRARFKSLNELTADIELLAQQNNVAIAMCRLKNSMKLLRANIDNAGIFPLFAFLLHNNNVKLANRLLAIAQQEGDKPLLSNIAFQYADYYMKHNNWQKVLQFTHDTFDDLPTEQGNQARLYHGIALQKLKKHRQAVNIYKSIPSSSAYYPAARLNIATAYIRQDWWTDAHIEINNILKNKKYQQDRKLINRLYLVLAYSFLHKEFYRNSREAFRNIELDSQYFNHALLGIVLTAMNQKDYIGALNAINILRKKHQIDLSADEAWLLLPYTYEKLGQLVTASASYTDAQTYYKRRIAKIKKMQSENKPDANELLKHPGQLIIENTVFDTSGINTGDLSHFVHLQNISHYIQLSGNQKILQDYKKLFAHYKKKTNQIRHNIYAQRISRLNSYMNQARYGLARLFDNSKTNIPAAP